MWNDFSFGFPTLKYAFGLAVNQQDSLKISFISAFVTWINAKGLIFISLSEHFQSCDLNISHFLLAQNFFRRGLVYINLHLHFDFDVRQGINILLAEHFHVI